MGKKTINDHWKDLFDTYNIIEKINKFGFFEIKATDIKQVKEPRVMVKWDSSDSLPKVFKDNRINILPISRGSYVLSDFMLYHELPPLLTHVTKMEKIDLPELESVDINNITSEAVAINILYFTNILTDFTNEANVIPTFNGRMSSGKFDFLVDRFRGSPYRVNVNKAQCEIDGGFENDNSILILEAKNVVNKDFHVRQLYYPYRLWKSKVNKPIRLLFSIYSNRIFRLFEYHFENQEDYSSIVMIKEKNYSFQDTDISTEDLEIVFKNTEILFSDDQSEPNYIPFVQADSFEKVITILEILANENKTKEEISEIMQFAERQADYYYNAGKYLGLFRKVRDYVDPGFKKTFISLTELGKTVNALNYKARQLKFAELILQHKIFNELFEIGLNTGEIPGKDFIQKKMFEYNVCGNSQNRRASSVISWLNWIFNLINV